MEKNIFKEELSITSDNVQSVQIDKNEIGSPPIMAEGTDWGLGLVNRTPQTWVMVRTKNNNGAWGKWWDIPEVGFNCDLGSYHDCVVAKKYTVILSTSCTSASFSIQIATHPDANNNAYVQEFSNITPSCQYAGGAIGIDP